ncbi:MAG: Serine/threonine protein kinase with repeat, partial [Nevskia sp.]|nr:Serine/threonine protein kinase with repeat [Nevskia sp.]
QADRDAPSQHFAAGAALCGLQFEAQVSDLIAGADLGPYRLERSLGSGGMGEVLLARRTDGVFTAPVALKMLHAHLAQSAVRERFLREGRMLGQLLHAHVARLLDAGIAASGQPYLAIEYVEGERVDHWCDNLRLNVIARLQLFLQICDAVAHAHAHLIVHRDLKPSNILVTADGGIKLLDFGIAKLIDSEQQGAPETELTRLGGRALTPEYAAPEQISGAAITTATDVYSLGVLLYLLLGGCRPYGKPGDSAAQLEQCVLETEPPPLSQARPAQTTQVTLQTLAATRATTPRKLRETLRGDLDTIVGKALKKAPAQRYLSVLALADDLRRFLNHEPVLAQPDSFGYRTRKYLRRHRLGAAAGAAVALAVVAGLAGTLWQAQRAQREAQTAREQAQRVERTKEFFVSIFQNADPLRRADSAPVTLVQALDDALKRVDTELTIDPSLQGDLLDDFGEIKAGQGDLAGAKELFQRALPLHEQTLAADAPALANTLVNLGVIESYLGHSPAGRPYLERAVAILEQHAATEGDALSNARNGLAQIYSAAGDDAHAAELVRKSLDYYRRSPGPQEMRLAISLGNVGTALLHLDRYADAQPYFDECVTVVERNLGKNSPNLGHCLVGLFRIAAHDHDLPAQAVYAERNLALNRANFSGDHQWVAQALSELGQVRLQQRRSAEGESLLRESIAMYERLGGDFDLQVTALRNLAQSRQQAQDPVEALSLAERGLSACAEPIGKTAKDNCEQLQATRTQALADLAHKK